MSFTIRPFRGPDTEQVISVWNAALPYDALTRPLFERKVVLDKNQEPDGLLVAESDGRVAGFCVAVTLRYRVGKDGLLPHRGYINAMGVHPDHQRRGIGSGLLERAEAFLRERGRKEIAISPNASNYFVPGVDKDNYATGVSFLQKRGFVEFVEALAADAPIATFRTPEKTAEKQRALTAEGITVEILPRDLMHEYLRFHEALMPGPWWEDSRHYLSEFTHGRFPLDSIWVAIDAKRRATADPAGGIIGFCQHDGEHFGPFGVDDAYQGKGIGSVLLARCMEQMRIKGCHSAWVLWTGQRALDGVYGRLGFKLSRRFAVMRKEI